MKFPSSSATKMDHEPTKQVDHARKTVANQKGKLQLHDVAEMLPTT
jgi:hypothetical protein